MTSRGKIKDKRWNDLYCWYWALRHEPKRIWLWWWMCRVPLSECARATCENMLGFEYTYAQDMPEDRLRLRKPRQQRRLEKLLTPPKQEVEKEEI